MPWKSADLPRELGRQLDALVRRTRDLAGAVDAETLSRRPAAGGWSAAECIDHLNATARLYLPVFDDAIEAARRGGLTGDRADGRTLLGRLVVWTMEPPPRFRMGTWDELEPARTHDPAALVEAFASLHGALAAQLEGAVDLDRKRIKVRSLLDSRLKLSLDDWYAFMAAHARRHLWQAERALEATGGP